ncbi:hypothetical protein HaLaN_28486, partial [Haematococcus lacustris]
PHTQGFPTWGWQCSCKYSLNSAPFAIPFITLNSAKQCASFDHQRRPLESLLAYCHMCPRTNHCGDMGLLGTGSVTLRGAESKLGHGVELWSCVTDCMALALRSAKGVGGSQTKSSLSDARGRSDDCMLRNGSNLNHKL